MSSIEHKNFIKRRRIRRILVHLFQVLLLIGIIAIWELLAKYEIINTFISSSPSRIFNTIVKLYNDDSLFNHIWTTIYETIISFGLGTLIGILMAIILWWNNFFYRVLDPYLTIINSLPKVAIGPIIIIYFGANIKSIIIMALLISVIVTIITVYNGFIETDQNRINLLKSFKASKYQIFRYVILPSSYPTIIKLYNDGNLFNHIWTTIYETLISFGIGTLIGIVVAIVLWYSNFLYRIFDPYLTIINSLPKVAIGPIIIIYFGANIKSIIIMALLISVIVTIITVYNGFISTDQNRINLLKSFKASKRQIFRYVILPSSYPTIISSLKINISMTLIGVIMGEFLVSKSGIGYLIIYGTQIFNLNIVMSGILILIIISYVLYKIISIIENKLLN